MKQIKLKDENGKEYTLEYTKAIIIQMEKQGFNFDEIDKKPVLMVTMLVQGAFAKNHSSVKYEKIEKIFNALKDKQGFLSKLKEMYEEHENEMFDEGNSEWEANW